jgi:hypothetical protein
MRRAALGCDGYDKRAWKRPHFVLKMRHVRLENGTGVERHR